MRLRVKRLKILIKFHAEDQEAKMVQNFDWPILFIFEVP